MQNAFLVIRTVFFALFAYFHALILVFASWNIVAAKSSGMSAPGASVFLLMSSVFIYVLVPIAYFSELICARARTAHVRVECAWTAFMSIFQLAASIDVTMNGPAVYCQTHSSWAMCASSSLLVHVGWLATLIIFSYCLTICVASAAHASSLPDIWITPVPRVPWFRLGGLGADAPASLAISHAPNQKHAKTPSSSSSWSETSCAVSKYVAERWEKLSRTERQPISSGPILFSKGHESVDSARPAWARLQATRRGVDNPFAKSLPKHREPPTALAPPPRVQSRQVVISRGVHSVEVSERPETTMSHSLYSNLTSRTSTVFPWGIANPDLPIPRPRLSEWVPADVVKGVTVHTERIPSS